MKKRKIKKEKSISFPAWFTISLTVILSLVIRCTVHLLPFGDTVKSIISDVSIAILSIAILDFFLTISSEQKLISSIVDSVQYKIAQSENFFGLSENAKAEIIKNIYLSCFDSCVPTAKEWYQKYVSQYCQYLSLVFRNTISTSKYYSEYARHVDIILRDQDIKVKIIYRLTLCNPALEECAYIHDPMFKIDKEFNSYEITSLLIDEEQIDPKLSGKRKIASCNSLYISGKKIEYDLSHKPKAVIVQEVSYETDYNQFFQTYWLRYPCENFRLDARVTDCRKPENQDTTYTLHWELFGPLDCNNIARNRMNQTEFSISTDTLKNLPQGSGFVLCLGSTQNPRDVRS